MNTLHFFAALPALSTQPLINLLAWFAIAAVVIWALIAIVRATGINIPPIVRIVLIALASIAAIIVLFRIFAALVS